MGMTQTSKTPGRILADTLRKSFRIGTRTRRHVNGNDLHVDMIESIENAVTYPGYYSPEKTEILRAAWGAALSYRKHYDGHRMSAVTRWKIGELSAYQFAALLGCMVDAGVATTGDGERFFARLRFDA